MGCKMRLMMMGASLRKDSYNKKLIRLAARLIRETVENIDVAELNEFDLPLYNPDIEIASGFPRSVLMYCERMQQADGLILSVPEYNDSIPSALKNLIDWVSHVDSKPWKHRSILLLSASHSANGGHSGLWATRVPLEACGAFVYPSMFSLATAQEAFDPDGELKDKQSQTQLINMMHEYVNLTKKLK